MNTQIKYIGFNKPELTMNGEVSETQVWDLTKKFINSLKDNQIFTRNDFLKFIYKLDIELYKQPECMGDCYRRAMIIGDFVKFISTGKYKKIKSIPFELTHTQLIKFAYDTPWKKWFIPLEERIKNEHREQNNSYK